MGETNGRSRVTGSLQPGTVAAAVSASLLLTAALLGGCQTREIRVHNASTVDFTTLSVGDRTYDSLPAGSVSDYRDVTLRFRYATIWLTARGRRVSGQTLSFGADRFTHRIDIVDLDKGHLAIRIIPERGSSQQETEE